NSKSHYDKFQILVRVISKRPYPKSRHPERSVYLAAFSGPHSRPLLAGMGRAAKIGSEGPAPLVFKISDMTSYPLLDCSVPPWQVFPTARQRATMQYCAPA